MLSTIAPVRWNIIFDAFRAFGCHNKPTITALSDIIPTAISPRIVLLNEEIRGKAQLDQRTGRTILVFKLICGFAFLDNGGIPTITLIHFIYKAIFTAVPWIPWDRFLNF